MQDRDKIQFVKLPHKENATEESHHFLMQGFPTSRIYNLYCKLVKVWTLCILCNNWSLFVSRELTPELAWHPFKHSLGQVSLPG